LPGVADQSGNAATAETPVAFISHRDCGRHDTGWGHPEHVGRLRAVTRALRNTPSLFASVEQIEGRHATIDELTHVHSVEYVAGIQRVIAAGGGQPDPDTVVSEGSWDAATAAAGCVLTAIDRAMSGTGARSFCAVRPPGHHALKARSMGFCILGNVAIAARYAQSVHGIERVLIVDWDVHHGNGTQALVETDPTIHFVSMHQWPWYPGTGAADDRGPHGNVWNLPMPAGLAPERYVETLRRGIDAATLGFVPDIVLISAGFDSLAGDPLGGFTLEPEHIAGLTREVVERARGWCAGRVVSVLEGGYAPDRLADGCIAHLAALAD
jgi:acetoin utilization deacetylase AcuC-like enzyme